MEISPSKEHDGSFVPHVRPLQADELVVQRHAERVLGEADKAVQYCSDCARESVCCGRFFAVYTAECRSVVVIVRFYRRIPAGFLNATRTKLPKWIEVVDYSCVNDASGM